MDPNAIKDESVSLESVHSSIHRVYQAMDELRKIQADLGSKAPHEVQEARLILNKCYNRLSTIRVCIKE